MCGRMFYKKHVLEGHLRKHCGLKVISKFSISIIKIKEQISTQAFQCDLCEKGFEKRNRLLNHRKDHHQDDNAAGPARQFQCDYSHCTKSYQHSKSLRDHIKSHHLNIKRNFKVVEREIKYSCTHCGKKYKKKEYFEGHLRQHQGLDVSIYILLFTLLHCRNAMYS